MVFAIDAGISSAESALPRTYTVQLVTRWRRGEVDVPPQVIPLRRDVPAGDTVVQALALRVPTEPGDYTVEIALEQDGGTHFTAPGNAPLRLQLPVLPKAPRTPTTPAPGSGGAP